MQILILRGLAEANQSVFFNAAAFLMGYKLLDSAKLRELSETGTMPLEGMGPYIAFDDGVGQPPREVELATRFNKVPPLAEILLKYINADGSRHGGMYYTFTCLPAVEE